VTTGSDVLSAPNRMPSVAELRAVVQPPEQMSRYNAEHWVGGLYMRKISLHATRYLIPTGISANGVTWLLIFSGIAGAACLLVPGVWGPLLCALLMQVQILFDCSDGEVARWRQKFSPAGIYLDRVGHYTTESSLPIFLGLRADGVGTDGSWQPGGWTTLGLLVAVIVLLPKVEDHASVSKSRVSGLAAVRQAVGYLPFFRAFVAVEFSLLTVVAGIFDQVRGDLAATQVLLGIMVPLVFITAGGHLLGVLSSSRLKA
jgi:phosphatidylglycerophosphate synthase